MDPNLRLRIKRFSDKGRPVILWLVSLFLLTLLSLGLFTLKRIGKLSTQHDFQRSFQARRDLATSGDPEEMAAILDQSMVFVPDGEFLRGSEGFQWDERPEKQIYLNAFSIDQYEVTNAQYQRFLTAAGEVPPPYWDRLDYPVGQADYPVVGVSWEQASNYCRWAGKRLPTEAEWEKACRGTDGRLYPWGNQWRAAWANLDPLCGQSVQAGLDQVERDAMWEEAWMLLQAKPEGSKARGLRPVGSYPDGASPYGVLDMAGNASEWVADWYIFADYSLLPDHNPITSDPEWNRALRGSAWYDPNGSSAWQQDQSRCSARNSSHVEIDARVGFRCAKDSD